MLPIRVWNSSLRHRVFALLALMLSPSYAIAAEPLVVHEWGVMIREGGDLLAPPVELFDEVPKFVLQHHTHFKPNISITHIPGKGPRVWRKPVLHFYGEPGTEVSVQVMTPKGRPLMYWPQPKLQTKNVPVEPAKGPAVPGGFAPRGMKFATQQATGMQWSATLVDEAPENLALVAEKHWWSSAREIPSMYLKTNKGSERFIFYEATGKQEPTVTVKIAADAMTLTNGDSKASGPVVLLIRDESKIVAHTVESIPASGEVRLTRAELLSEKLPSLSDEDLLEICRKQWQSLGMTREEAQQIVDIWKTDLLEGNGFLLMSRLPSRLYDAMFPLTITPKPAELVRVGMIFDLAQDQPERIKWLPRTTAHIEKLVEELGDDKFAARIKATNKLAAMGNIAEPHLKQAAESSDAEIASRAKQLLDALAQRRAGKALPPAPQPKNSPFGAGVPFAIPDGIAM